MKKRDYAGGSQKMAGNEQIAAEVGKNPNGVGYVGLAYTKAGGVKVMPIDGVLPSVQSVHAKTYPYARPTFYYTNGEPTGLAKQFLDFTISGAGQKIAARVGSFPFRKQTIAVRTTTAGTKARQLLPGGLSVFQNVSSVLGCGVHDG